MLHVQSIITSMSVIVHILRLFTCTETSKMTKATTCLICGVLDPRLKTVELRNTRYDHLKIYMRNLRNHRDHAHVVCLRSLCLTEMPRNHHEVKKFTTAIEERMKEKIGIIVNEYFNTYGGSDCGIHQPREEVPPEQREMVLKKVKMHMHIKHPTPEWDLKIRTILDLVLRSRIAILRREMPDDESHLSSFEYIRMENDHSVSFVSESTIFYEMNDPINRCAWLCIIIFLVSLFPFRINRESPNEGDDLVIRLPPTLMTCSVTATWNNLFSLLDVAMKNKPASTPVIRVLDLIAPLFDYAVWINLPARQRNMTTTTGNISLLYVRNDKAIEVLTCIRDFWQQFRRGGDIHVPDYVVH